MLGTWNGEVAAIDWSVIDEACLLLQFSSIMKSRFCVDNKLYIILHFISTFKSDAAV